MREAVGALLVCIRNPGELEPKSSLVNKASPDMDPAERADVRALRDLMRDIGAVKERIDEERGGVGDVPGILVLVGGSKSAAPRPLPASSGKDEMGLGVGGDEDLDGGSEDEAFSAGWWEDQLFDMGLIGWEVVEWDPRAEGAEKTRNKYGGMFLQVHMLCPSLPCNF